MVYSKLGQMSTITRIQVPIYFVHLKILIEFKKDKELIHCREKGENYLFLIFLKYIFFFTFLGWISCSEWTTYGYWRI